MRYPFLYNYYFLILIFLVINVNFIAVFFLIRWFFVNPPIVPTNCGVVPFEQWSGSSYQRFEDLPRPVGLVVVTHTVIQDCHSDEECSKAVRDIRNMHLEWGWDDIGLSFLVGGHGRVYEAAGWKEGAHTLGYNNRSISLSFLGDFTDKLPTSEALEAAQDFLGCQLNYRYLACNYSLVGHRQLSPTLSPGNALHNHIQSWPHWTLDTSEL